MARFGDLPSTNARQVHALASLLAERTRVLGSGAASFLQEVAVEGLTAEIATVSRALMTSLGGMAEPLMAREGLLALWLLHTTDPRAGFGPEAASRSVQVSGSAATAVRLWLMELDHADPKVAEPLLRGLEHDIAQHGVWAQALGGSVVNFMRACVAHPKAPVRLAVLAVLQAAMESGALPHSLPPQFAAWLADALEPGLRNVVDSSHREVLRQVQAVLRAPTNVTALPLAPRALQRVVLDLQDFQEEVSDGAGRFDALVDHTRRRQLLDDAGRHALRRGAPVQTLRLLSERASTRVVQAFVSYDEAIVSLTRDPDFSDVSSPDYGTEVAWAPAASVPFHIYFGAEESRRAFDVIEQLLTARGSTQREAVLQSVEPAIARALQRFLDRLSQQDGELELVLTDPDSPEWQQSLRFGRKSFSAPLLKGLAERASAEEPGQHVVVHKNHVPQANTVRQVFQAVDAMMLRGVVTPADIGELDPRQVDYYKHAARTLGLFDDDNQPTDRARALEGLSEDERLAVTAVYFEDSPVGRAWRAWAGKSRLKDVDPQTAQAFVEQTVRGLTGTTPKRRASTLRTWFKELMPHYPT